MATAATKKTKAVSKKPVKRAESKVAPVNGDEFAIIETGSKQYRVSVGDSIKIEIMEGVSKEGEKVVFDKVLMVDNGKDATIGDPYIKGAKVEGTVAEMGRARKVDVVKYKAKSRYFKRNGHRQPFCKVTISAIK